MPELEISLYGLIVPAGTVSQRHRSIICFQNIPER